MYCNRPFSCIRVSAANSAVVGRCFQPVCSEDAPCAGLTADSRGSNVAPAAHSMWEQFIYFGPGVSYVFKDQNCRLYYGYRQGES